MAKRTWMTLVLLATVVAPATADVPRLRRMVVVGDSLLAGFGSGGLVARGRVGQVDSAPAFVARRARRAAAAAADERARRAAAARHRRRERQRRARPGRRPADPNVDRLPRSDPYRVARNLAVPGEDIGQRVREDRARRRSRGASCAGEHVDGRDVLKFLILGLPLRADSRLAGDARARPRAELHHGLDRQQRRARHGDAAPTPPPSTLDARRSSATASAGCSNELADTGAGMAVANLPDVTGIAALRRAAGEVTSCPRPTARPSRLTRTTSSRSTSTRAALPVPPCGKVLGPPSARRCARR